MSKPIVATKRMIRRLIDRLVRRIVEPSLTVNIGESEATVVRDHQLDRSIHDLNALIGTVSASIADQQQAQAVLIEQLDRRLRDLERPQ